jgi:hypothetical protein
MAAITTKAYDLLVINKHQKGVTTLSLTVKKLKNSGKIGFWPDGLRHVGIKVSGTDLCANILRGSTGPI